MKHSKLVTKPLTREAFSQFGDVIEIDGSQHYSINEGAVERYHDLANLDIDDGGRAIISFFKINHTKTFPHKFNLMERHPKGSQAFIPMFNAPVVIVVAPKGESFSSSNLQAFATNGKQGFNFKAGVWHMPLISDVKDRLFVVVDRSGPGENCDEVSLENETIELTLA
ncbi:ureidoglycolate lyase [Psychrobium sp. nBUS_13]|uniref:ureidoglycolate lyase n=1 Tax=Psychrobium sp. nBUS_13 TaxID=3395319 RepID=UPI003EBD0A64